MRSKLLERNRQSEKKFTSTQINHFVTISANSLLKQFSPEGKLNLSGNRLGANALNIKSLLDALKVDKTITELNLSSTGFGRKAEDMKNLADALKENQSLEELYLEDNGIEENEEYKKILLDLLKENQALHWAIKKF